MPAALSWGLMFPECTLHDAPPSKPQSHTLQCLLCPSPIYRLPGQISLSPPFCPSPRVGSEERKGVKRHEFAFVFISKQDSGSSVDLSADSGHSQSWERAGLPGRMRLWVLRLVKDQEIPSRGHSEHGGFGGWLRFPILI